MSAASSSTAFAVVGLSPGRTDALVRALEGAGRLVAADPRRPADREAVLRQAPAVVLVGAGDDPRAALDEAARFARAAEVVLLAPAPDAELLRAAMRAGCRDVLDPADEVGALRDLLAELGERGPAAPGRVLAVLGCQGGVGATTVTVALGHLLAQDPGRNVIVTDIDVSSGDLLAALDLPAGTTTEDVLRRGGAIEVERLRRLVHRHEGGFAVLPQPPEDLDSVSMSRRQADDLLGLLVRAFDDVVVDLGSALAEAARGVVLASDHVVLVATQEVPALRKAARRLLILRDLGVPRERVHLVLNRYHPRLFPSLQEVADQLRHPVIATIANDYKAVNAAIGAGETIFEAHPRSAVARDLRVLKARIFGEAEPGRRGWLR